MPLYHNQVCTSFLGYKVTQILYNKLTQARPPTTTAKPSNSQMFHIKNTLLLFFFHFLATISHITREKKRGKKRKKSARKLLGSNNFWFLENNKRSMSTSSRLSVWAPETYILCHCVFKPYKYIWTKIYQTICYTKRINAKWKLTIINFNNLKMGILSYFSETWYFSPNLLNTKAFACFLFYFSWSYSTVKSMHQV